MVELTAKKDWEYFCQVVEESEHTREQAECMNFHPDFTLQV